MTISKYLYVLYVMQKKFTFNYSRLGKVKANLWITKDIKIPQVSFESVKEIYTFL